MRILNLQLTEDLLVVLGDYMIVIKFTLITVISLFPGSNMAKMCIHP